MPAEVLVRKSVPPLEVLACCWEKRCVVEEVLAAMREWQKGDMNTCRDSKRKCSRDSQWLHMCRVSRFSNYHCTCAESVHMCRVSKFSNSHCTCAESTKRALELQ